MSISTNSKLLDLKNRNDIIPEIGIELLFDEFRKYQDIVEEALAVEKDKLRRKSKSENLEEVAKKEYNNEPELINAYENYLFSCSIQQDEILNSYFQNFRISFLVQIISFIEFELKEICEYYRKKNNLDFSPIDLSEKERITREVQYLERVFNIEFKEVKLEWEFINLIIRIKDILVGKQGFINRRFIYWDKIKEFTEKYHTIELINYSPSRNIWKISIKNKKFNKELIDVVESFFLKILKKDLVVKEIVSRKNKKNPIQNLISHQSYSFSFIKQQSSGYYDDYDNSSYCPACMETPCMCSDPF